MFVFTDDTQIVKTIKSLFGTILIQDNIDCFNSWCILNEKMIYFKKCYCKTFNPKLSKINFNHYFNNS